ncbi:unnamed protein product [Notodromas monacha]|uniref:Uncharacterized protein n=1 Tax=Notodromas monacha TaxID=399045 RepID=A0A7R9BES3_9CRUS|nr:unnamed protein product [Notodromas monacha]CAG0913966.1 unnamed protein product [Notodromas monacha]
MLVADFDRTVQGMEVNIVTAQFHPVVSASQSFRSNVYSSPSPSPSPSHYTTVSNVADMKQQQGVMQSQGISDYGSQPFQYPMMQPRPRAPMPPYYTTGAGRAFMQFPANAQYPMTLLMPGAIPMQANGQAGIPGNCGGGQAQLPEQQMFVLGYQQRGPNQRPVQPQFVPPCEYDPEDFTLTYAYQPMQQVVNQAMRAPLQGGPDPSMAGHMSMPSQPPQPTQRTKTLVTIVNPNTGENVLESLRADAAPKAPADVAPPGPRVSHALDIKDPNEVREGVEVAEAHEEPIPEENVEVQEPTPVTSTLVGKETIDTVKPEPPVPDVETKELEEDVTVSGNVDSTEAVAETPVLMNGDEPAVTESVPDELL